jgi:hypothetical protein
MAVVVTKPALNVRSELADLRKPTGIAGEAMLRAETVPDQAELLGYRQSNVLINGSFEIAQRGTTINDVENDDYTLDRWKIIANSAPVYIATQSTDTPNGFAHSLKLDVSTADTSVAAGDYGYLNQPIEGNNLLPFASGTTSAKAHTLSFWVKSNVTGAYVAGLRYVTAGTNSGQSYTINTANTWEYKTVVFPPQTTNAPNYDNTEELTLLFWFIAGTTYTGGAALNTGWSTTNNTRAVGQVNLTASTANEFLITGAQLVAGNFPEGLPFQHEDYGTTLAKCQRYYYAHVDGADQTIGAGANYSSSILTVGVNFPVTMRAEPTAVYPDVTNGFTFYRNDGNDLFDTFANVASPSLNATFMDVTSDISGTAGHGGRVKTVAAGSYLHFKAEL